MAQRIIMKDTLIISNIKGGFGNQLHQYGTGLAVALKLNARFKVDLSFYKQEKYKKLYKLDKVNVNLELASSEEIDALKNKPNAPLFFRGLRKLGIYSTYRKKTDIVDVFGFMPDKRILNLKHSAYISGWCPKEVYVREIRTTLVEQFKPKMPLSRFAMSFLRKIEDTNSVSLHIRRGDFLELEHFFRVVPIEFYKMAVAQISTLLIRPTFFIFSNDIDWARNNIDFIKDPVYVDLTTCENYTGNADIEEYELMKHCQHNIIGNSSFSWWAAYLNNSSKKTVIAPKKWFNDPSIDTKDLIPDSWIRI